MPNISNTIAAVAELFRDEWPSSAAIYLPGGEVPAPGMLFRNPGLAATYRRILSEGEAAGGSRERRIEAARSTFRGGFVAEAIERFCRAKPLMDSSGAATMAC